MSITVMKYNSLLFIIFLKGSGVVQFDYVNDWLLLDNYFLVSVCTWVKWQLPSERDMFYFYFVLFIVTAFVLND